MPKTSIYTCVNTTSGIMMKFWLITMDDCYLVRYDEYKVQVMSTQYQFYYSKLFLVFIVLLIGIGVYLRWRNKRITNYARA